MSRVLRWLKSYPGIKQWNLVEDEFLEPSMNIAVEELIGIEVGEAFLSPTLRLWKNRRKCLILGPFYAKKFASNPQIKEVFKKRRIALVKRFSGGEAAFQDFTCLNFSITVSMDSHRGFTNIKDAFEGLCSGVIVALNREGIHCQQRKVEAAFCSGPYDLAVDNRKLAGVSMAWRSKFILVHGTLLVNADIDEYFKIMKEIYLYISPGKKIEKGRMTTLAIEKGEKINLDKLSDDIVKGYSDLFQIDFIKRKLSSKEREIAEELKVKYKL
ncbi:MAG: biotin/lipoate A/B protein ligase family protein [Candidatus Aerophobetes bacterium]|nr:biotin/lipoate A/B protein ligase family protein [Candidatus Aerophobetes bacterium]